MLWKGSMVAEECAGSAFVQTSFNIGRELESECHKRTYGTKCDIIVLNLDKLNQDLLLWRSGMHPMGMRITVQGNITSSLINI